MQHDELRHVIELAAREMGGGRQLAEWLEVSPQRLTDWKNGHRDCPPDVVAVIAHAAKLDANQWLARATLWKCQDKPHVLEALGKSLRATGAALALCIAPGLVEVIRHSTMYRLSISQAGLR